MRYGTVCVSQGNEEKKNAGKNSQIKTGSIRTEDYSVGLNGLPASDVLKYYYRGPDVTGSVVIRPSGTEPKLKAYISVTAADRTAAEAVEEQITAELEKRLK